MKLFFVFLGLFSFQFGLGQQQFSVYFDFNKSELTALAKSRLDSFVAAERGETGKLVVAMSGHCDSIGSHVFNKRLSRRRLDAVKKFLLDNGLTPKNFSELAPLGEEEPVAGNHSEEGRQLNRRVQIHITKKSGNTDDGRTLTEQLTDTTATSGTKIILRNLNFYGGTPFLLPQSFPILDELLEVMKRHTTLVIEVQGHICCVPYPDDSPYNPTGNGLSEERARAIWAHLIGNGIAEDRVSYKGFGHSQPIYPYPEQSEAERSLNRRVEVKIVRR